MVEDQNRDSSPVLVDDGRPPDEAVLWRRVLHQPSYIVEDANSGTLRVSSAAFDDFEMSVDVAEEAMTVDTLLRDYPDSGVVAFSAGFARSNGQGVCHDAWPDNPAHGLVFGNKSKGVRRAFARNVRWQHRPSGYDEASLPDPV